MDEVCIADGLVISCCQSSGIFEFVEAALEDVSQCADGTIDLNLDKPIFFVGIMINSPRPSYIIANEMDVKSFFGQQHFSCRTFCLHDREMIFVVGSFTARENNRYGTA